MGRMIDDLLDFTRVRAGGGIAIHRQAVDLASVYAAVAGEFELSHPSWKICWQSRGNLSGAFDPDRLRQVLSNVISNAGQHGQAGQPINVTLDGGQSGAILLEVQNQGAIPGSVLPHVFDPFRTTQRARGKAGGLGLGLFIVREIVRAHGGTVEVSSSEALGTTVSIRLPRAGAVHSVIAR
jgi:signal transduction histidine kinase